MLENGANVNAADKLGRRPVHYAALDNVAYRSVEVLAAVMDARDLDARTVDGDTAMHFAASAGNVDTLRALAECGAAPAPRNNRWETPLDVAKQNSFGTCAQLLERRIEAISPPVRQARELQIKPLQPLVKFAQLEEQKVQAQTPPPSAVMGPGSGRDGAAQMRGQRNLDRTNSVKRQQWLDEAEQKRLEVQLRFAQAEQKRRQSPPKAGVKFLRMNSVKPGNFGVPADVSAAGSALRSPGISASPLLLAATAGAARKEQTGAALSPGWAAIHEEVVEKKSAGGKFKKMVGGFKLRLSGGSWRRKSGSSKAADGQ